VASPLNGISNRIFIERSEVGILTVAFCESLDHINGSRDTANVVIEEGLAILTALRQEI
jgi:hypothetical protein